MKKTKGINRREFLKNSAFGIVGTGIAGTGTSSVAGENGSSLSSPQEIKDYRKLGRTGFKASDISLGGVTNVDVIKAMLDAGVNYIDTAESYARGNSEISMGQAIKGRDRKSLFINTKLHLEEGESKASILERAHKCLERLDTEYIDCLMTHNPGTVKMAMNEAFHKACQQLKSEGKLRFVGISSHGNRGNDEQDTMEEILLKAAEDGRFDVMLLVYNFLQPEAGEKILRACQEKNIGATLMKTNPVGRYQLLKDRVEALKKEGKEDSAQMKRLLDRLESAKKTADEAEWFIQKYNLTNPAEIRTAATRFGLSHPAVATVLARTNSFEDMDQFLKASGTTLSSKEFTKLEAYSQGPGKFYCRHACGLCETSCPHQVPVNTIMRYNHYFEAQGQEKYALGKYAALTTARADLCENCDGHCESHCVYGVPIQGLLILAHMNLSLDKA
jgi:aryl-alcohol dehydrogenase-like predicted oxidoreductase